MQSRPQSRAEEHVNALTHGVGAVLGCGLFAVLLSRAFGVESSGLATVAAVLYGLSAIGLFGASTVYHAVRNPWLKRRFQKLDHCAIYLFIAGSYTPFTLLGLEGAWRWVLFVAVWSLAGAGLAMELLSRERWERTALGLYLIMGWMGVFAAIPFMRGLAPMALVLVTLGGLVYTAGTVFYRRDAPWDHAVWHGFVLGGASLHGVAVVGFVL